MYVHIMYRLDQRGHKSLWDDSNSLQPTRLFTLENKTTSVFRISYRIFTQVNKHGINETRANRILS